MIDYVCLDSCKLESLDVQMNRPIGPAYVLINSDTKTFRKPSISNMPL